MFLGESCEVKSRVKTSGDWMSLFLGSKSGQGLQSPSIYSSKTTNNNSNNNKMYDRSFSYGGVSSYGSSARFILFIF